MKRVLTGLMLLVLFSSMAITGCSMEYAAGIPGYQQGQQGPKRPEKPVEKEKPPPKPDPRNDGRKKPN